MIGRVRGWLHRLRVMIAPRSYAKEVEDEVRFHLELEEMQQRAGGVSASEAPWAARRGFGNQTYTREEIRRVSRIESVDRVVQDFRFALRSLRRAPLLTAVVVGTLSVGIALVTTFFSFVNTAFYRPLPYADVGRTVLINPYGSPPRLIDAFRGATRSFERIATFDETDATISGDGGDVAMVFVTRVDTAVFPLLKQQPILGRLPTAQQILDDEPVIVIGDRLWRTRFGSALDVVGRSVILDDVSRRIVAVMPPTFTFHERSAAWIPFPDRGRDPTSNVHAVGKLLASASRDGAQQELRLVRKQLKAADSTGLAYTGAYIGADMVDRGRDKGPMTTLVALVVGAAVCVLLVACTNVATLMLARGARRRGEIVIRASLGASRWQLIRQQLAESLLLAGGAFVVGTLLSIWGIHLVVGLVPTMEFLPQWIRLGVDQRVLAFSATVSLLTVSIFGLWPARESTRVDLNSALRADADHATTGKDPTRRAHLPVVLQLMFSVMLFIGAVALAQTFRTLSTVDHGYRVDGLTRIRIATIHGRDTSFIAYASLFRSLREDVASRAPSVPVATEGGFIGFSTETGHDRTKLYRVGETQPVTGDDGRPYIHDHVVSPNYFQVMGIPLVVGRALEPADVSGTSPVAVVSRRAATAIWGSANPIGKRLIAGKGGPTVTIVGVVGDLRAAVSTGGMRIENQAAIYFPDAQTQSAAPGSSSLLFRSTMEPSAIRTLVGQSLSSLGRTLPVSAQTAIEEERIHASFNSMMSTVMATFAATGLILSIIGIYGVVAFGVEQRTREMGVRIAMGATPIDIIRTIIQGGARLIAIGVGFGLVGAAAVSRLLAAFVLGSTGAHVVTAIIVAIVFASIALIACYIPARRAAQTDPMVALKG